VINFLFIISIIFFISCDDCTFADRVPAYLDLEIHTTKPDCIGTYGTSAIGEWYFLEIYQLKREAVNEFLLNSDRRLPRRLSENLVYENWKLEIESLKDSTVISQSLVSVHGISEYASNVEYVRNQIFNSTGNIYFSYYVPEGSVDFSKIEFFAFDIRTGIFYLFDIND